MRKYENRPNSVSSPFWSTFVVICIYRGLREKKWIIYEINLPNFCLWGGGGGKVGEAELSLRYPAIRSDNYEWMNWNRYNISTRGSCVCVGRIGTNYFSPTSPIYIPIVYKPWSVSWYLFSSWFALFHVLRSLERLRRKNFASFSLTTR